ncbi:MAG: PHB depolymerase family esterase [Actinomycetota bacterium]
MLGTSAKGLRRIAAAVWILGIGLGIVPGIMASAPARGDEGGPGSFDPYSYSNDAGTRPYRVYVPPTYTAAAMPLLVDLHGCSSNALEEARWSRFNEVAAARGFLVAYPEQDPNANGSRCWNWFEPANQFRDAGEPSIIAGITRAVMKRWKVDPRRVYVFGISAGGAMSNIMAVTYPDLYAAAGVYAGCEYRGLPCMGAQSAVPPETSGQWAHEAMGPRARVVPLIVIQGDSDPLVPAANAELTVQQWLTSDDLADDGSNNATVPRTRASTQSAAKPGGRAYEIDYYTDKGGCVLVERWLIHGMGHQWSNATSNGSARDVIFTDPLGPDITPRISDFLMTHPMPTRGTVCLSEAAVSPAAANSVAGAKAGARALASKIPATGGGPEQTVGVTALAIGLLVASRRRVGGRDSRGCAESET